MLAYKHISRMPSCKTVAVEMVVMFGLPGILQIGRHSTKASLRTRPHI